MNTCLLVINYNGLKYLEKHLSDMEAVCKANDVRLIISDGGSKDESLAFLQKNGYEFTTTAEPGKGFANNVNHAVAYAKTVGRFDYYIISNNDIALDQSMFSLLKRSLLSIKKIDPSVGIIGFKEILKEDEQEFRKFDYASYNENYIHKVPDIPGFFMLIADEVFTKAGMFDEEYFMYGEDNDFFERAKKAGFTIYNTGLPVLHYSEGSSTNSRKTSWYVYRNAFLYAQKNLGFGGFLKMLGSFMNQIYNPFFKSQNAGNMRVVRNGFFYNNYLLAKSLAWNLGYFFRKRLNG